jgi:methylase of polypeptide subunit release factors
MQKVVQTSIRSTAFGMADSDAEARYNRGAPAEHRRQFGQVFTPPKLADLMADWVMGNSPRSLLDPAYGTGVLTAACLAFNSSLNVTAYEIDGRILKCARSFASNVKINNRDFLRESIAERYDSVIMNPPYIRHREISGYDRELASISTMSNVAIPKSANLYVYFSIKALELLLPNGRAAILIPSEWMSANFSKTFKSYLLERRFLKNIIVFSNCSNVFDDALTTASVILCEK